MARLTQIEAGTVIPANGSAVWRALLDHTSWAGWEDTRGKLRLEHVEPLSDPGAAAAVAETAGADDSEGFGEDGWEVRVGDRRRCTALVLGAPLLRRQRVTWDEQVSDVDEQRTLELEAIGRGGAIRRWRLRFWLVGQPDGQTRLRCRLTYRPATFTGRLFDRFVLRGRLTRAADEWLAGLAASLGAAATSPAQAVEHLDIEPAPQPEPIRIDADAAPVAA